MSPIPTSPVSPTNKRRSIRLSSFEVSDSSPSPYTSGTTNGTTFSRRSSRTSQTSFMQSPVTQRPTSVRSSRPSSSYDRRKSSSRLSLGSNISFDAQTDGLGNLADELECALEDEYEIDRNDFIDEPREGDAAFTGQRSPVQSTYPRNGPQSPRYEYDPSQHFFRSPTKKENRHERTGSRHHNSNHEQESEEVDGITLGMAKRMMDIETLARLDVNLDDLLSEEGGVVTRTIHALQNLDTQANLETILSRVTTAHTSMATHRTHKTRDLHSQANSLLYGGHALNLPESILDDLLANLETLSSTIHFLPHHQPTPLLSLQIIASQTLDLAHTLRMLTDTLQESRIQANIASRKLKSVRDMVEDLCAEQELVDTSIMLIQAGDWDRRCKERQAAATCREVVRGFGEKWGLEVDEVESAWIRV